MRVETLQHMERAYGLDIARALVTVAVGAIRPLVRLAVNAIARFRLAMRAQRDRAALRTMSDRQLNDIGIPRHALMAIEFSSPEDRS